MMKKSEDKGPSRSFVMGVVALVFMVIGYQVALFIHRTAVLKIEANRDRPDTVYVYETVDAEMADEVKKSAPSPRKSSGKSSNSSSRHSGPNSPSRPSGHSSSGRVVRKNASHSSVVTSVRENTRNRKVESFRFNPNTASEEDFFRLGFTIKQARSIINYREKGGRFRRKEDFSKSFVVSDSIYRRLEPYIDIPLIDLNLADSADFDALPGIGGWFASKMVAYRRELRGYSYKEQLMDIWKFDRQKYDGLKDLITISKRHVTPYNLWSYPADSLRKHPYIRNYETARAIVLYREKTPKEEWTVDGLRKAGVISDEQAEKLSKCALSSP